MKYNTAINPLGSITDINVIFETIRYYNKVKDINKTKQEFVDGNAFGFNISSSRKRFFSVIKKLFLSNPEDSANSLFIETIASINNLSLRKIILYLEVFRKNDLFHDITTEFIFPKYKENRRLITSSETFDFLQQFGQDTKIAEWSESTVKIICSKYIGFMKRIGFFKKDKGVKSMFAFPYPDEKIIAYIVYLLKESGLTDNEIYESDLYTALMLDDSEKIGLLKQGTLKGYYDFSLSGSGNANFTLNYNREEFLDELS